MTRGEINERDLGELVERVREAAGALIQGDIRRYFALMKEAPDYTLMPPTGGPPGLVVAGDLGVPSRGC